MIRISAARLLLCIVLFQIQNSWSTQQQRVEELLSRESYTTDGIGIMIKDLQLDSVVVSINCDSLLNPASVLKLLTSAASLELLGLDYTFSTYVYIDGTFNSDSGTLDGNLYVQGRGDPGLSAERLWLFVQHLRHRGIKKIRGNLILDDFYFDSVSVGPGFSVSSAGRAYSPLIHALSANFSSVAIHHRSGQHEGSAVVIDVFPKIEGLRVVTSARTGPQGGRGNLDVTTSLTSGQTQVNIRGVMSLDESPRYTYRRVWQTWETFGGALRAQFTESGIEFTGHTIRDSVPDSLLKKGQFYAFRSPPLTEYVNHMLKHSSNFAAEMILKTISAESQPGPGDWDGGVKQIERWWEDSKLPGRPVIGNGSGMGDVNRISAAQVVELLCHVSKQWSYYPDYLSALAVANVNGTLSTRFHRSRLRGIVRAKTGTLNTLKVSTLAGFILLPEKSYVFAILFNNTGRGQYDNWVMQERILESVTSGNRW